MSTSHIGMEDIGRAFAELNTLAMEEYEQSLDALLQCGTPDAEARLKRLTGIVLKRNFATRIEREPSHYSATQSRYVWPWKEADPDAHRDVAEPELELLNALRTPGSWLEPYPRAIAEREGTLPWRDFKDDVENERGLFKVLALYISDKLEGRTRRGLEEYFNAPESPELAFRLDMATEVFQSVVTDQILQVVGVPSLAVDVALIGIKFGYRKLRDPNADRVGDSRS